jgi:hypothetical protein
MRARSASGSALGASTMRSSTGSAWSSIRRDQAAGTSPATGRARAGRTTSSSSAPRPTVPTSAMATVCQRRSSRRTSGALPCSAPSSRGVSAWPEATTKAPPSLNSSVTASPKSATRAWATG